MKELSKEEKRLLELDILRMFFVETGIPKDKRLDNEIYYQVYKSKKRYNLIYGGRGSGKSFEIEGKLPIVLISCLPFCRILMIRQVYNSIKGSQFQEICDYIDKWDLYNYFDILKSPMRITHKASENSITFAGMDKPQSLKSIKDVTHVIFGEAFHIDNVEGISVVDKSVRTPRLELDNHKLFFVFNPDNKQHHLFEKFFDDSQEASERFKYYRDNSFILQTTYKDNKFVPEQFSQLIEADSKANPERYKVDALGQWGELKKSNLYYQNFNHDSVVEESLFERVYDSLKPLHITFDFNVFPYISLIINQLNFNAATHELEACQIDEICLTESKEVGNIEATCKAFLKKYHKHIGTVVIYGDKSGHNKKTNALSDFATIFLCMAQTPQNKYIEQVDSATKKLIRVNPNSDYEDLNCIFRLKDQTIRTQNPLHQTRKLFFRRLHSETLNVLPLSRKFSTINAAGQKRQLSELYGNVKIVQKIDSSCRFLIKDFMNVEEDEISGTKSTRDKNLSHTSDASDYFFCQVFDAEFLMIQAELKK